MAPTTTLAQRVNNAGFCFEVGDFSHTSYATPPDDGLELHLAQFHLQASESI